MWLFAEENVYHATGGPRLPVMNEIASSREFFSNDQAPK
jgi:hypothetical protein